ncbi:MAG: IS607 family transposase [Thiotrichaceae bacterium]|nr:IS607 family transposase [Thiotrichaceae bacterium]
MNLIKLSLWAKKNGYSYRGAYNRFHAGRIEGAYKNETGRIVVPVEENLLPLRTIVYARVSSLKQKKDLERQAERMQTFCVANGWIVEEVVTEIASGLNDKRPKLEKILKVKTPIRLVVEHKDRLTRFGFHYIETLLNGEVIIANKTSSDKEDLMQDLISIITSMVVRYYGQRHGSRKAKELIEKL